MVRSNQRSPGSKARERQSYRTVFEFQKAVETRKEVRGDHVGILHRPSDKELDNLWKAMEGDTSEQKLKTLVSFVHQLPRKI